MATANTSSPSKIPFLVKAGYGGYGGSELLVESAYYTFFLYFATDVMGIGPAAAGTIMLIASIADGISDPLAGVLTDRLRTRWGRRRPLLLAMAVPYGLVSSLLFFDPGFGPTATFIYFAIVVAFFFTVTDLVIIPGKALGAEMSLDYDERTDITSSRIFWAKIGELIGFAGTLTIATYYTGILGSARLGWAALGATLGLIAIFPILLTWRTTRGYERYPRQLPRFRPKDLWISISGNRPFRYAVSISVLACSALYAMSGPAMYYLTYWMQYDEATISRLFLILTVGAMICIPPVVKLAAKVGKRNAFIWTCALAAFGPIGFWFVKPGQDVVFLVLVVSSPALISAAYALIAGAMIADAVEVDEFKHGQRREGFYYAIASFLYKIAIAVVLWISGITLEWFGYQPGVEQSEATLTGIRALISWGPMLFIVLAVAVAFRSPMTRQRHAALVKALELKKAGEVPDTTAIRELLR